MNTHETVGVIANDTGLPATTVRRVLARLEHVVTEALSEGETVLLTGFLKFEPVDRPARVGRNPQDGSPVDIAARRTVRVKAMATLKNAVADG